MESKVEVTRLDKIVANLRLKELEIVEKLSKNVPPNSKILRSLISPNKHNFIAVNGDWKEVLGYTDEDCRDRNFSMIIPDYEKNRGNQLVNNVKELKYGFSEYLTDIITKDGRILKASWRSKYFSDLNMVYSIGTLI